MSLDPRTRALLDRSRAGFEPSREDAARVEAGVLAAIGATAVVGGVAGAAGVSAKAAGLAGSTFAKLALSCLVAVSVAVGGAAVLTRSAAPAAQEGAPAVSTATTQAPEPVALPVETAAPAPPPPIEAPPKTSTPRAAAAHATVHATATSTIAEEVAFVREGTTRLHAGDPVGALSAFEAHASAFPHGILEEERSAGRVLALCALGRTSDARARAAELRAAHPASPHAARIRQSCVGFW